MLPDFKKLKIETVLEIVLNVDGKSYISQIAKKTDVIGIYHLIKVMKTLENEGIISTVKSGRTRIISLTDKGELLKKFAIVYYNRQV